MSSPISSQFPNTPPSSAKAAAPAASPAAQPPATRESDKVDLTLSQRIHQLHIQGQRVSQIASALNLSEAAVNSYLNVSSKS